MTEVTKRHTVSLTEVDSRAKGEYESKLEDAIMELRDQQNADLEQMREDLEVQYEYKVRFRLFASSLSRKSPLYAALFFCHGVFPAVAWMSPYCRYAQRHVFRLMFLATTKDSIVTS